MEQDRPFLDLPKPKPNEIADEKFGIKAHEVWSALDSEGGWMGMLKVFAELAGRPGQ